MQTHASKPATPKKAEAKPAKTATKDSQPQTASKPAEKGDKTPYAGQETKRPHLEEVGNVKLEDLKAGQCKWPHGDPLSPSFGFCGAPAEEGLPYCRRHAGKAYTTWRDEEAEAELEAAAANAGEAPADVAQQHSARRAAGSR
jgi:GcrA cell cycle regulator